jgi:hypothetical protein
MLSSKIVVEKDNKPFIIAYVRKLFPIVEKTREIDNKN